MTFSSSLATHYLALAEQPIEAGNFGGEDARYSSEYEQLEAELAKASSLHQSGQIDWQMICDGSEALLRTQSKDLRVAAWLVWALYQRERFTGLHHFMTEGNLSTQDAYLANPETYQTMPDSRARDVEVDIA